MNEKQSNENILMLKRLILAHRCFTQITALCDHLAANKITQIDSIYTPCIAGISVTYMKPFVQSKGLGPLPNSFRKFDDLLLKHTHERLEESRNRIYAHSDVENAHILQYDNPEPVRPYEIRVELKVGEPPTFCPMLPDLNAALGIHVRRLCVLQAERAGKKMNEIMALMNTGKEYKAGSYILGENFP